MEINNDILKNNNNNEFKKQELKFFISSLDDLKTKEVVDFLKIIV